jgi:transposase
MRKAPTASPGPFFLAFVVLHPPERDPPGFGRENLEVEADAVAIFEVLLYDLTRTYFECDPPEAGKRRCGYSRDKRSDCVQVVIALVVTPDGLPLAYEVMAGNTSDKTTLREFIERIVCCLRMPSCSFITLV